MAERKKITNDVVKSEIIGNASQTQSEESSTKNDSDRPVDKEEKPIPAVWADVFIMQHLN